MGDSFMESVSLGQTLVDVDMGTYPTDCRNKTVVPITEENNVVFCGNQDPTLQNAIYKSNVVEADSEEEIFVQAEVEDCLKSKGYKSEEVCLEEMPKPPTQKSELEIDTFTQSILNGNQMRDPETPSHIDNENAASSASMPIISGINTTMSDNVDSDAQESLYKSYLAKETTAMASIDSHLASELSSAVAQILTQDTFTSENDLLTALAVERFLLDEKDSTQLDCKQAKNQDYLHVNVEGNQNSYQECTEQCVGKEIPNNVELISHSCQLSVLETLQDTNILCLPQQGSMTAVGDVQEYGTLSKDKNSLSSDLSNANSYSELQGSSIEKQKAPFKNCVSESNCGVVHVNDEQVIMEIMESAVEVVEIPHKLESSPGPDKSELKKEKKDSTLVQLMHKSTSSLSVSMQASNQLLPQEEKDKPCNKEIVMMNVAEVKDDLFKADLNQNAEEEDQNNAIDVVRDKFILLSTSENVENKNESHLQDMRDKSCSSCEMSSADQICQQMQLISPETPYFRITSDSETEEFITDDGETSYASFLLKHAVELEQCESSWYAEESLRGLTYQDVKNICEAEIEKRWGFTQSVASSGFIPSESKEIKPEHVQISTLLNVTMHQPQVQEQASISTTNKDISSGSILKSGEGKVIMPISRRELPICPTDTEVSRDNSVDKHDKDLTDKGIVLTSGKNPDSPDSEEIYIFNNQMRPLVCFSCPLLDSWNEHSGDEFDFQQSATSESLVDVNKEAELQSDSCTDDPKTSTERSHSQRVRIPLCNLFAEDSISVSDSDERGTSTEQECGPLVHSIPDICPSRKEVATTKTNKEKQKLRSFFRHCICLPAVH